MKAKKVKNLFFNCYYVPGIAVEDKRALASI